MVYAIVSPLCNTALEMVVLQPVPGHCNLGSQGATGTRVPGTNSDYIPWMVCSLKQSKPLHHGFLQSFLSRAKRHSPAKTGRYRLALNTFGNVHVETDLSVHSGCS